MTGEWSAAGYRPDLPVPYTLTAQAKALLTADAEHEAAHEHDLPAQASAETWPDPEAS
jgi:hypothetical protein